MLDRLQADATLLRSRYNELQEALLACDEESESMTYVELRELRELRDTIQGRLGDAVAALETIRLDLLRLHAGADSIASLTTQLGLAAEVFKEVDRLVAARTDVERIMRFPRERAATPV
ncbi:MAG: hypothetical protein H0X64_10550 [Gemmatimonadaceae bacterium]|nr:hypothetical protein [Gemmatimonadaceae bacterium]